MVKNTLLKRRETLWNILTDFDDIGVKFFLINIFLKIMDLVRETLWNINCRQTGVSLTKPI